MSDTPLPDRVRRAPSRDIRARIAVDGLLEHPNHSWVGVYWLDGDELVLGPWNGPQATEHERIPIGQGVCGAAAASGQVEIVDDVSADERYLACFPSTKSEIVVPILGDDGTVVGEIDVDSDTAAAFGEEDADLLRAVADAIMGRGA